MATQQGLVRSFYGWLVRKERSLRESDDAPRLNLLPSSRPTSISRVRDVAEHAAVVLAGTEHEVRANYWSDLFDGIARDGWHGEIRPGDRVREKVRQELKEALVGRDLAL